MIRTGVKNTVQAISYNLIVAVLLLSVNCYADEKLRAAVIYPDIREPYRTVFMDIISGVESSLNTSVHEYIIYKDKYNSEKFKAWLEKKQIKIIFALGRQGLDEASKISSQYTVVAGAILFPSVEYGADIASITLTPSPRKLFSNLKKLSPDVKRVSVIYSDKFNGWLINDAKLAAKSENIELNALKANSIADAATLYKEITEKGINHTDAIWLLRDSVTVDNKVILPMLLKKSWDKGFIVFSNNPAHVRRGVLFSLYPDNKSMGSSLGSLAIDEYKNKNTTSVKSNTLEDLLIAVNVRTADHLGLKLNTNDQREFDLVFPQAK